MLRFRCGEKKVQINSKLSFDFLWTLHDSLKADSVEESQELAMGNQCPRVKHGRRKTGIRSFMLAQ